MLQKCDRNAYTIDVPRASPLPLSGVVLSGAACAERRCMCPIGAACGHFWRGAVRVALDVAVNFALDLPVALHVTSGAACGHVWGNHGASNEHNHHGIARFDPPSHTLAPF